MSEQKENSHYRVAYDLAFNIYKAENYDGVEVRFVEKSKAREYWLRLFKQCLDVTERRSNIESILQNAKLPE